MPIRVSSINVAGKLTGIPSAELKRELEKALDATAKVIAADYAATVSTWSNKPSPVIERPSDHERVIGIDEQRWLWVNEGTRPHRITPRSPRGKLRFREGYRAKTSRGSIRARQGGPTGGVVYSKGVQHPGTQAREFDDAITRKNDNLLDVQVNAVLAKV